MASIKSHIWVQVPGKTIWHVARDYILQGQSTRTQTYLLVQDIKNMNPSIDDWNNVPPRTLIYIPLK